MSSFVDLFDRFAAHREAFQLEIEEQLSQSAMTPEAGVKLNGLLAEMQANCDSLREQAIQLVNRMADAEDNERILEALLEFIPEGVTIAEAPDVRIKRISRYGEMLAGLPRQELEGTPLEGQPQQWQVFYKDAQTPMPPEQYPLARAVLQGEVVKNEEIVITQPDGHTIPLLCNAGPVRNAGGEIIGGIVAWMDIHELKRVQAEREYQAYLLENVHDAVVATDEHLKITFWNRAAERLYGWKREKALGQDIGGLLGSELGPQQREHMLRILEEKGSYYIEMRQRRKDGSTIVIEGNIIALRGDDGQIMGYVSANRDITAKKTAEAEQARLLAQLQQERQRAEELASQAHLRAEEMDVLFSVLPDPVIVYDGAGNITRANQAAFATYGFDLTGVDRREIMQRVELKRADGRPANVEMLPSNRALHGQTVVDEPMSLLNLDGKAMHILVSARPIYNPQNELDGAVLVLHDITEREEAVRKQAELDAENRRQRNLLERLIREAPTGICFLAGPEYRYTLVNPAYEAFIPGKGQLIDRTVAEVLPEAADQLLPLLDRVYKTGESFHAVNMPVQLERERGAGLAYFTFTYTPLYDDHGQVEGILAMILETTEQVQIRKAVEEERARLEAIFEYAPEGIVVTDKQCRVILANPVAERLVHRPMPYGQDYATHAQLRFLHTDGAPYDPRHLPLTRAALDGETFTNHEMLVEWPDGQRRMLLSNIAPIRDTEGKITGAIGVFQDVTEFKRTEQQLRQSQERFQVALKNSPITVYHTDQELRYTWIHNPQYGGHPDQIVGKTDEELLPAENVAELVAFKRSVLESGQGARQEIHLELDGKTYIYDLTAEPLRDEKGKIQGLTVAAVNITEQRRMEEAMLRNALQIELQQYLSDQMENERMRIARDLHDGPVQDLLGLSFNLQDAVTMVPDGVVKDKLKSLQENLKTQISNLRHFSYDLRPPMLSQFGLEKTILSYADNFQAKYPELIVQLDLMPETRRLNERVRTALFRVLQEALNNVVRHAHATAIWIRLDIDPSQVVLSVEDDGRGFEQPETWLELARQGHLGLAGIQERVSAIQGEMDVESQPGKGTRLLVRVPLDEQDGEGS